MVVLSISQEKCRQCYRCVQGCPTNALKIDRGKVKRIEDRCILCGACYKNCPHGAIVVHTGVDHVLNLLKKGENVVACLDPTFPAVLDKGTPGQLITALKKLGFKEVWESASGGELIVQEYKDYLDRGQKESCISSFCPSLVLYIEKFVPQFAKNLVPIVSPMIATGRLIKNQKGSETKVVFIGSCLSRVWERRDSNVEKSIDYVLTYHDIRKILETKGIDRQKQEPSDFDGSLPSRGRLLSIASGMSQCIGIDQNLINLDFVVANGSDRAMRAVQQLQEKMIQPKFMDLLFCKGCIDGPMVDKDISGPSRRQIVVNFIKTQRKKAQKGRENAHSLLPTLDLKRGFTEKHTFSPEPGEAKIQTVLKKLHKTYPNENLDCGLCGYETCYENARAVVQGFSELEMCPHYLTQRLKNLVSRLEKSHIELRNSHTKLESAQRQLIQTEKMASLGQLAAGVAHELNNPMGTITLFGRILQKELSDNPKWQEDIGLIVQEADRAAKIVKDLLNFSRKAKVKPGLVNINQLMEEALSLLVKKTMFHNIQVQKDLDSTLPTTFADADLLKQVLLNIILNGAQAMEGEGILTIKTKSEKEKGKAGRIRIQIEDSGQGIPQKNMAKLFDPFFTTKEKGTGLGLAIAYGIISQHKGTIKVKSQVGKGTIFTITLPVLAQKEWMKRKKKFVEMNPAQGGKGSEIQRKDLIG